MAAGRGAMLRSASEPPPFVLIGNPDSRRVELFQAALAGLGLPPARLLPYADLLAGRADLAGLLPDGAVVRIESPDRDVAVERALIAAGAPAAAAEGSDWIDPLEAASLEFDKGRIRWVRQWYLGLRITLEQIGQALAACPPHRLMNAPGEIALMFDKGACHARLAEAGLPVARALGPVRSYDELMAAMARAGMRRVFVKLAHGSSASGAVAYQTSGTRHHATSTVELVEAGGALRLYNTRRLRVYQDQRVIARLIDALCRERVHVEQWLPKAGLDGATCDLRVVVIGGRARHTVVRLSRSPLTNLHLLNQRGSLDRLLERMPANAWAAARHTCERALACFPHSHYAGIDLLLLPGYRRHAILELNAFGDLLPGVLDSGQDTYAAEIVDMLRDA